MDEARYHERENIAHQIEDMRSPSWPRTAPGRNYNLLTSQDARVDMLRTLEFDHKTA